MSHISYLPQFAQRVVSLLIAYVLVCSSSFAAERSFETCHQIAREAIGTTTVTLLPQGDVSSLYYVFVGSDGGYAIVSSDDRTPALLGYSKNDVLKSVKDLPLPMQFLLQQYSNSVDDLKDGEKILTLKDEASSSMLKASRITGFKIEPLLGNIKYDQYQPYNNNCPVYNDIHCVTGCVPTAVAQVMRYYKYPNATIAAIPSYITGRYGLFVEGYQENTDINWEDMLDNYKKEPSSTKQADAVSQFMAMVGTALNADYGIGDNDIDNGTPAYTYKVETVLPMYFGYDADLIRYVLRSDYTLTEWNEILLNELLDGRPIIMGGEPTKKGADGHTFVCDGIDESGLYHINWGWGGMCDGYFDITILNPTGRGTGGGTTTDEGFHSKLEAIIGIQPRNGVVSVPSPVVTTKSISFTTNNTGNPCANVEYTKNYKTNGSLYMGIGYAKEDGKIVLLQQFSSIDGSEKGDFYNSQIEIPTAGFEEGKTYKICLIESLDMSTWKLCEKYDTKYFTLQKKNGTVEYVDESNQYTALSATLSVDKIIKHSHNTETCEYQCNIHFTNSGNKEYYGTSKLRINSTNSKPSDMFIWASGETFTSGLTVEKNSEYDVPYTFTADYSPIYYWVDAGNGQELSSGILEYQPEKVHYTVSYYAFGELLGEEYVKEGGTASGNPDKTPQHPIYTFSGWDKDLTNITSDREVNAIYTQNGKKVYCVYYYEYRGNNLYGQEFVLEGESASGLPDSLPKREGYTFVGWDRQESYLFADWDRNLLTNITSNIEVYAVFNFNIDNLATCTVSYRDWDGTPLGIEEVEHGSDAVGLSPNPERDGYTFIGWNCHKANTLILDFEHIAESLLPNLHYSSRSSGSGWYENNDVVTGRRSLYLSSKGYNEPTNISYSFEEAEDLSGSTAISFWHKGDAAVVKIGTKRVTDESYHYFNVEKHTNWTLVTIKWDELERPNSGIGSQFDFVNDKLYSEITEFIWETATINNVFGIDDVSIEGIDLSKETSPISLSNITGNIVATAQYRDNSIPIYTVSYVDWDGTPLGTEQVGEGENASGKPKTMPSRDGYMFAGWQSSSPHTIFADCENGEETWRGSYWYDYSGSGVSSHSIVSTGANSTEHSIKFTYSDIENYAGIGFSLYPNERAVDLSGSTGISFYHKGDPVIVEFCTGRITDNSYHIYEVLGHQDWTLVTINWSDIYGPGWGQGDNIDFDKEKLYSGVIRVQWKATSSTGSFWIDEVTVNGRDLSGTTFSLTNITKDVTLTAQYKKYFTVTYLESDGSLITTEQVVEGSRVIYNPYYEGETYGSWALVLDCALEDEILSPVTNSECFQRYMTSSKVTKDITLIHVHYLSIEYKDWDGTLIRSEYIAEGGTATGGIPSPNNLVINYGYLFIGWDKPLTNITESTVFTAQYGRPIVVTYYDWDGTKLGTKKVGEGGDATNLMTAPKRKGYIFVGWDKPLTNVTEDISVTAQYEINSSYHTVTYLDWDGMELGTEQVEDSWDAVGLSPNPQRDGYTFVGWDKSLTNITSDMSVTAQYEEKPLIFYTVTYMDWDGKILGTEQVPEGGDAVGLAENPQRAKYSFIGWSKPLTNITSKTTLIALYQPSTDIPSLDNVEELTKPQKVFKDGEIYILLPDGRKINIKGAELIE